MGQGMTYHTSLRLITRCQATTTDLALQYNEGKVKVRAAAVTWLHALSADDLVQDCSISMAKALEILVLH